PYGRPPPRAKTPPDDPALAVNMPSQPTAANVDPGTNRPVNGSEPVAAATTITPRAAADCTTDAVVGDPARAPTATRAKRAGNTPSRPSRYKYRAERWWKLSMHNTIATTNASRASGANAPSSASGMPELGSLATVTTWSGP